MRLDALPSNGKSLTVRKRPNPETWQQQEATIRDLALWLWWPLLASYVLCFFQMTPHTSVSHYIAPQPDKHTSEHIGTVAARVQENSNHAFIHYALLGGLSHQLCYFMWQTSSLPLSQIRGQSLEHQGCLLVAAQPNSDDKNFLSASYMAGSVHGALSPFLCDWLHYYFCFKGDTEAWRS